MATDVSHVNYVHLEMDICRLFIHNMLLEATVVSMVH
jgi:hypothetical protein